MPYTMPAKAAGEAISLMEALQVRRIASYRLKGSPLRRLDDFCSRLKPFRAACFHIINFSESFLSRQRHSHQLILIIDD